MAALITRAGQAGIQYTRTGTNGFLFRNHDKPDFLDRIRKLAETLADTPLRNFWVSIDSAHPATHEKMRGFGGVIQGIAKAIPVFHEYGIYPTANLGLNRNLGGTLPTALTKGIVSKDELDDFISCVNNGLDGFLRHVENMGFTIVNFCYPMSTDNTDGLSAVYAASSPEHIVNFTHLEKAGLFTSMLDTLPRFRSKLRIFTPLSSVYTLRELSVNQSEEPAITPFPCRGGLDYFFIPATNGKAYPCGYRGDDCMGSLDNAVRQRDPKKQCTLCDWECFRDPSELFGPFLHGISSPLTLFTKYRRDKNYYRLWRDDIRYYRACEYFNGRKNLHAAKLKKYGLKQNTHQPIHRLFRNYRTET